MYVNRKREPTYGLSLSRGEQLLVGFSEMFRPFEIALVEQDAL